MTREILKTLKTFWSVVINGKNAKTYWDSETYQKFFMKKIFHNCMKCLQIFLKCLSKLQVFQYELLNNVLYLQKMLFRFGNTDSPPYYSCKMVNETPLNLLYNCTKTKLLRDLLK